MSKTHLQATAEEETRSNVGKIIAILLYAIGSVILLYLIILLVVLLPYESLAPDDEVLLVVLLLYESRQARG